MILTHYSSEPILALRNVKPGPRGGRMASFGKPVGFWLSDESDEASWSKWCAAESYPIGPVRNDFAVDLSGVLHLKDTSDLLAFNDEYKRPIELGTAIDWRAVGSVFRGILITPYAWECRLDLDWYYGWDCASGCFWDVSCLTPVVAEASA